MAARGWTNSTVTAIGVSAGAAAAQFGLGYGLGIVVWQPVTGSAGEALWLASLAWVVWIAASSATLGAIVAQRRHGGPRKARGNRRNANPTTNVYGRPTTGTPAPNPLVELAWRVAISLAAAIGATLAVPLVLLPARAAHRTDTFQPQLTAGAYAVVGVVIGLVVALAAVNARVVAANVLGSVTWAWVLAAASVVAAARAGRTTGTAQLAAWQFAAGGFFRSTGYLPGALLMLGAALLVGVFAALPADRRQENRIVIAVSGAVGPLLVAAAYLLAAPTLTVRVGQLSAYLFAPYAVIAGLAGSVLVAALAPMRPKAAPAPAATRPAAPPPAATPLAAQPPGATPLAAQPAAVPAPPASPPAVPLPRRQPAGAMNADAPTLRLDGQGGGATENPPAPNSPAPNSPALNSPALNSPAPEPPAPKRSAPKPPAKPPVRKPPAKPPVRKSPSTPVPPPAIAVPPAPEAEATSPYPDSKPAATTTATGPDGATTPVDGDATTQSLWPQRPKPRKGRPGR